MSQPTVDGDLRRRLVEIVVAIAYNDNYRFHPQGAVDEIMQAIKQSYSSSPENDKAVEGDYTIKDYIGLTLQESGIYPYPEFVNPLVKLFEDKLAIANTKEKTLEDYLEELPFHCPLERNGMNGEWFMVYTTKCRSP